MSSTLRNHLRPERFTRGRVAAWICLSYLAIVTVAWLYTIYDAYFVDQVGASFAGVYVIVLTAPTSFLLIPLEDLLGLLDPRGVAGEVLLWALMLLPALIQAGIGWVVMRGRRVIHGSRDALDPPMP